MFAWNYNIVLGLIAKLLFFWVLVSSCGFWFIFYLLEDHMQLYAFVWPMDFSHVVQDGCDVA